MSSDQISKEYLLRWLGFLNWLSWVDTGFFGNNSLVNEGNFQEGHLSEGRALRWNITSLFKLIDEEWSLVLFFLVVAMGIVFFTVSSTFLKNDLILMLGLSHGSFLIFFVFFLLLLFLFFIIRVDGARLFLNMEESVKRVRVFSESKSLSFVWRIIRQVEHRV